MKENRQLESSIKKDFKDNLACRKQYLKKIKKINNNQKEQVKKF